MTPEERAKLIMEQCRFKTMVGYEKKIADAIRAAQAEQRRKDA